MIEIHIPHNSQNQKFDISKQLLQPFDQISIDFITTISKEILSNPQYKSFPEIIALGFWMRKTHIQKLEQIFKSQTKQSFKIGRGIAFHITPSNVDTMFVYSWFLSLLVGNSNIIKLSTTKSIQTKILLDLIQKTINLSKYQTIKEKTILLTYTHNDDITYQLSHLADIRIIWGGDNTIEHIRQIPIKPSSTELIFADKFSFSIISAAHLIKQKSIQKLIELFYNDSFIFNQMGCSSIRSIVWIGDDKQVHEAQQIFWNSLENYVQANPPQDIVAADINNKLVTAYKLAIESNQIKKIIQDTPYLYRIQYENFKDFQISLHCGSGLFYECCETSLEKLFRQTNKHYQTISYYGLSKEKIIKALQNTYPIGIDRIVPIGKSLNFSYIWDGFNLLDSLTREIEIWS
jgi:hypothetical protein